MNFLIWCFIIINIFLITSFILLNFKKNKKVLFRIFKIIFIAWIAAIISLIETILKPNKIGYFDMIIILGKVILVYALVELTVLLIKSNSKERIKIFKIFIVIFIIWSSIFLVDYFRVKNDKSPIFCFKLTGLQDGGTIFYIGIGYKVIDFHALEDVRHIIEKKYICPWNVTYEEALKIVKEEFYQYE